MYFLWAFEVRGHITCSHHTTATATTQEHLLWPLTLRATPLIFKQCWFHQSKGNNLGRSYVSLMPQAASHILKVFRQIDRNADINEKRLWNNENVMTVTMLGKQYHVIKALREIIFIAFYSSVKNWHVPSLQSMVKCCCFPMQTLLLLLVFRVTDCFIVQRKILQWDVMMVSCLHDPHGCAFNLRNSKGFGCFYI